MQRHGLQYSVYTQGNIHLADVWLFSDAMAFAKVADWKDGCTIWDHSKMEWIEI